jgi:hypothetical protein
VASRWKYHYRASGGSVINGTNGFRLDGINSSDETGFSVAAGSLRNNSYSDVAIAAPTADSNAGVVYDVQGEGSGWFTTQTLR